MVTRKRLLLTGFLLVTAPWLGAQQTKMLVTVFDEKTGESIRDLSTQNFLVVDDKTTLRVASADYVEGLVDAMVLVDTSWVGEVVRPLAAAFVEGLGEKEQMALVAYHSSADLIQDFTSSKQMLFNQDFRFGPGTATVYIGAGPNATSFRAEPCTSAPPVGARARPSAHRR